MAQDNSGLIATNRKAKYNYAIEETFEAGIALTGSEVKMLRQKRAALSEAYAYEKDGEIWLANAHIPEYHAGGWTNHAPRRSRKLLLHRKEIMQLQRAVSNAGMTLVPLKLYFKGSRVKVLLALARGKREWDKRQTIRERQDNIEAQRAMSRRSYL